MQQPEIKLVDDQALQEISSKVHEEEKKGEGKDVEEDERLIKNEGFEESEDEAKVMTGFTSGEIVYLKKLI